MNNNNLSHVDLVPELKALGIDEAETIYALNLALNSLKDWGRLCADAEEFSELHTIFSGIAQIMERGERSARSRGRVSELLELTKGNH